MDDFLNQNEVKRLVDSVLGVGESLASSLILFVSNICYRVRQSDAASQLVSLMEFD